MTLQIPPADRPKLGRLMDLSADELVDLKDALAQTPSKLGARRLAADLQSKVKLDALAVREIVRLLVTLYSVRADQNLSPEQLAEELCRAAKESTDEPLKAPKVGWDQFSKRLADLLSLDKPLGVTAKATLVAYQFPRHFHDGRIITDARPVFTGAASEPPSAFVINHTLQIDTHENGEDGEWFIALNTNDLTELRNTIDRALLKEKSLRSLLEKTGVETLDWEEP